jgi:hypothetical protein
MPIAPVHPVLRKIEPHEHEGAKYVEVPLELFEKLMAV